MLTGEKHLLLILKDNGKLPLGGAGMGLKNWSPSTVLVDLRLRGKIGLFDSGGKKSSVHIRVIDASSAGHPLLDEFLEAIKDFKSKKGETTQSVVDWVKWFRDKFKKKGYTERALWESLEKRGIVKNQGKKHTLLKPEIKKQLFDDIRLVYLNQKNPDDELKALLAYSGYAHGKRYYTSRSERDTKFSKPIIHSQIIPTITFYDIVVEKRKAIGGGITAASATATAATSRVVAASEYGVDTLAKGKSQAEAQRILDKKLREIR